MLATSGMPVPSWWSERHRGDSRGSRTRRTLLIAAAREIDACGYHAASLRHILETTGLTKGALYFHFSSKEELARAVLTEAMDSWAEIVADIRARDLDPLCAQLIEVDASVGRRMYDPPARAAGRIIVESGLFDGLRRSWMAAWRSETTAAMVEAARAGILRHRVEPAHLARSVLALTAGHFVLADTNPDQEDYFARMNDMWEGLLPVVTTEEWFGALAASGWLSRPPPDPDAFRHARRP